MLICQHTCPIELILIKSTQIYFGNLRKGRGLTMNGFVTILESSCEYPPQELRRPCFHHSAPGKGVLDSEAVGDS